VRKANLLRGRAAGRGPQAAGGLRPTTGGGGLRKTNQMAIGVLMMQFCRSMARPFPGGHGVDRLRRIYDKQGGRHMKMTTFGAAVQRG